MLLLASVSALAFFSADNARLEYAEQEYGTVIDRLGQNSQEATGELIQGENSVLAGGVVPRAEVVYPGRIRYVVLTNIPAASGKSLVSQLYPLSRNIIKIEP
jgi:hypothetical protein